MAITLYLESWITMAKTVGPAASILVLSLAALLIPASGQSLPSYIKVCKRNDPNLNECFLKSAQSTLPQIMNGDAKLKLPKLDPFRIQQLRIGQDSSGSVGLDLNFNNIDLSGLKNTVIKNARIDLEKLQLFFGMFIPKLTVVGPYEVSGKVLILPITGKGQSKINFENVNTTWTLSGKLVGKSPATQRMQVTDAVVDIHPEKVSISLEGLFGGDKTLGDQMNVFLNENWKAVFEELRGGLNEAMAQIVKLISNQVISSVTYVQLLPPN